MTDSVHTDFQVVSQAFGSWNVRFRIEAAELLNQEALLMHLRRIKNGLAQQFAVDESHLIFNGILRKDRSEEFVDVIVRITRQAAKKGNPKIHFRDAVAPEGTRYANMTALLDLFYLDQFEKPIMLDRVLSTLNNSKVSSDLIDWDIVHRKLKEVIEAKIPIKDIIFALGIFPSVGEDARVEFYFPAVVEPGNADTYYSSRRVSKGDILCRIQPAIAGSQFGKNVFGEELPARKGIDIKLIPQSGCVLSLDGYEAIADLEGVVVISRKMRTVKTLQGVKEIPHTINVKVNPVQKIDGNCVVDIASSGAVEVIGNLCMGSKILTDSEVYITGNVEANTTINASDDVTVTGQIDDSNIHSERNVIAQRDVSNSKLVARDQLIIKGTAKHSHLQGKTVTADTVIGGKVLAQKQATFARIGADETQILSTICVGMNDYFAERIRENEAFIAKACANLAQIETVFGSEIMKKVNDGNIQVVLMNLLSKFRLGQDRKSREQAAIYRKLLESIVPTRLLMKQKENENKKLRSRLQEQTPTEEGMVVITERMSAGTVVDINGIRAEMPEIDRQARIQSDGKENLIVDYKPGKDADDETERR
ncbi:FapA family protein [bacterium]|nr:FapA family protein [bacterium]MBU1638664.1 FapA family protein [bacterium]MBU1920840.1 FapA family protein [bacterium]